MADPIQNGSLRTEAEKGTGDAQDGSLRTEAEKEFAGPSGRIMGSLAGHGGLAGEGGLAGRRGGLAG